MLRLKKESMVVKIRGNCHFGSGVGVELCGAEVAIIAPNSNILCQVWERLDARPLETSLVENLLFCGVAQSQRLADEEEGAVGNDAGDAENESLTPRSLWDYLVDHLGYVRLDQLKLRIDKLLAAESDLQALKEKHFLLTLENIELKGEGEIK